MDNLIVGQQSKQTKTAMFIKPLAVCIQLAVCSAISMSATQVFAQQDVQNLSYNVSAGTLGQALSDFALQSGVKISIEAKQVAGLKSQGLNGKYSIEDGFSQLLKETNLQIKQTSNGYILVESTTKKLQQSRDMGKLKQIDIHSESSATNVQQLPLIVVNSDQNTTEGTGSYTTGKMRTATKLDLSIRETPQSVMVISNQMIEDRKTDEFYSLIKKITGISVNEGFDGRATYYSRGFDLDYYLLDGIPVTQNWYTINNYNMDALDRVEIVKGANGLLAGAGSPAVSINMIRKHATSPEFKGTVDASAGSWDTYKLKADIQSPLNAEGNIRGRFVTSYKDKNSFVNNVSQKNSLFYGIVDADISDNTSISFGSSYEESNRDGVMGGGASLPTFFSDGTRTHFNRSKSYMFDWSEWNTSITSYFADVKHGFSNGITLNAAYSHNSLYTKERNFTNIQGTLNKDGSGLTAGYSNLPEKIKKDSIDIYASIPFQLIGQQHELIVGAQYNQENDKRYKPEFSGSYPISNYLTQNGSEFKVEPNFGRNILRLDADTEQKSIYATGKFVLKDDLKFILGSRLTTWEYDGYSWDTNSRTQYEHRNIFTPFVGVVYDIDKNHSVYTSYTDIFQTQNYRNESGTLLDPKEGNNFEIGLKGEYFDGALNGGITLFRLEQDNVAEAMNGVFVSGTNGTEQAYRGAKGVTSKGIELEVSGNITQDWDINLGITHFEAKDAQQNKINTTTPRNNINLFTKYSIHDFSVGGGINWKSKGYAKSATREITQASYAVVDLMASYKINDHLSGQLNINNIFDKTYFIGYGVGNYNYGEPVNAVLSLKYNF